MASRKTVAIIPAAGKGTRLAPFPCPKELFPIGFQEWSVNGQNQPRPKVISQYIVEQMAAANVKDLFMILGEQKHDLMEYYGDGHRFNVRMNYLYQERINGMPFAINLASQWVQDCDVLFGMPDTIITPSDALANGLKYHRSTEADLTLGLFPTSTPQKFGMVEFDDRYQVISTVDKPATTHLQYMWGFACWSPRFTRLLQEFCDARAESVSEVVLGDVFDAAIESQLNVQAATIDSGEYIDIGTAEELSNALGRFRLQQEPQTFRRDAA